MPKRKATQQLKNYVSCMRNHVKTLEKTLEPIESEEDFFDLYDMLSSHKSDFFNNRIMLLAAWKRGGELFTLQIKETQELFDDHELRYDLAFFANPDNPDASCINLPVFCWRDHGDACIILWTATHARKLGLASDIVSRLGIKRVFNVLPESRQFWEHLGIPEVDKL